MITIIPAIDLKGGRCVRLRQGRADDATVYSEDPVEMAKKWAGQGATFLHIVDLDGAFQSKPVHTEVVKRIVKAVDVPVEAGGGLRTDDDIKVLLECGVRRAIVGTRVLAEPGIIGKLAGEFGDRLAVGIDAKRGMVQVRGWVESTGRSALDLALEVDKAGVKTLIYTDTSRDGMLAGVNKAGVGKMCRNVKCDVIAAGGIASVEDVRALRDLRCSNLSGAIVGKALYEGRVALAELIQAGGES